MIPTGYSGPVLTFSNEYPDCSLLQAFMAFGQKLTISNSLHLSDSLIGDVRPPR